MNKATMPTRDEINSAIESQEWVVMGKMLRRIADALADCVVVPMEPTQAMIEAAERREDDEPMSDWGKIRHAPFDAIYKAMLAAAKG